MLLHAFTCVCVLTGGVLAVATETVVGVAGGQVTLPCRSEAANQRGVEVCWGRGEPSLFTCHNAVINAAGGHVTYRKSYRFSVSPSSSLSIRPSRASDSGFYHCRVQLPGLFNDQTSSVHLIIISPRSVVSDTSDGEETGTLNAPQTTAGFISTAVMEETGSDVTTGPMVALVQSSFQQQQVDSLLNFVGNTVRISFIVFIPALLLTAAHRLWRSQTDRTKNQSEEEEQEEAGTSV